MPQSLAQFGQTIKAKHPEYADMADEDVANKVLAKYPEYHDMVTPTVAGAGPLGLPQPKNPMVDMQAPPLLTKTEQGQVFAGDLAAGALKGAGRTANNIGKIIEPDALLKAVGVTPPTRSQPPVLNPTNTAQKIGGGIEQAGEFLIPGAPEEEAMAKLAPYVGKAAPLLKAGLAAVGSGAVNKAQGGDFTTGAVAGGLGSGASQGLQKLAPVLAESALKVTGNDRMYGRTVGQAILDDTRGIKPDVIENSARAKIAELKPIVEQAAADAGNAGARGSLAPARQGVMQRIGQHTQNRAVASADELSPLQTFLQKDAVTGLPLAESQSPTGMLQLKRGLDADFIGNWNPTRNTNNELDAAKRAYGSLADEFHAAAPGTAAADQRISSLIPVANRADRISRNAGMLQNTMDRFRTPTGALVGMATGGEAGYHEKGLPGAVAGAAAGAFLPAFIGSPEAQMFMARGAYRFMPRLAVPATVGLGLQLKRGSNNQPSDQE